MPKEEQPFVIQVTCGEKQNSKDVHKWHSSSVEIIDEQICEEPGVQVPRGNRQASVSPVELILEYVSCFNIIVTDCIRIYRFLFFKCLVFFGLYFT